MKIEVKKTHIRRGIQDTPDACPIALAIQESLGVDSVFVGIETIRIGKKKIVTPQEARNFIERFDTVKSSVGPFSFEI